MLLRLATICPSLSWSADRRVRSGEGHLGLIESFIQPDALANWEKRSTILLLSEIIDETLQVGFCFRCNASRRFDFIVPQVRESFNHEFGSHAIQSKSALILLLRPGSLVTYFSSAGPTPFCCS